MRLRLLTVTGPGNTTADNQADMAACDRWHRRRTKGHRPRTSVWLLTLPAFFVLVVVASVVPRETRDSATAEELELQPQRSIGAQAIRTLSESLSLTTANWNADAEDAVKIFASLFEVSSLWPHKAQLFQTKALLVHAVAAVLVLRQIGQLSSQVGSTNPVCFATRTI